MMRMCNTLPSSSQSINLNGERDSSSLSASSSDRFLHLAAIKENIRDLRKRIAVADTVDEMNEEGQTPLFCAAFEAKLNSVKILLDAGADPNRRTKTGSTPVHAACASGSVKVLTKLVEFGGDLRLHDYNKRTPVEWAEQMRSDEKSRRKMLDCIEKLRLYSGALYRNAWHMLTSSPLMMKNQPGDKRRVVNLGFGEFYLDRAYRGANLVSCVPVVTANQLSEDPQSAAYVNCDLFHMAGMFWKKTCVTAKQLYGGFRVVSDKMDLLLDELNVLKHLRHPSILALIAVCPMDNFDSMVLLFERIGMGSLYYYLYETMEPLPSMNMIDIALQISDALIYLHDRGFVHTAVSPHSVHLVNKYVAKLGNFEYTRSTCDTESFETSRYYPESLKPWLAPEVHSGMPVSTKTDVYGICVVLWELFERRRPDELHTIVMSGDDSQELDLNRVAPDFRSFLLSGLRFEPSKRSATLTNLIDILLGQKIILDASTSSSNVQFSSTIRVPKTNSALRSRDEADCPIPSSDAVRSSMNNNNGFRVTAITHHHVAQRPHSLSLSVPARKRLAPVAPNFKSKCFTTISARNSTVLSNPHALRSPPPPPIEASNSSLGDDGSQFDNVPTGDDVDAVDSVYPGYDFEYQRFRQDFIREQLEFLLSPAAPRQSRSGPDESSYHETPVAVQSSRSLKEYPYQPRRLSYVSDGVITKTSRPPTGFKPASHTIDFRRSPPKLPGFPRPTVQVSQEFLEKIDRFNSLPHRSGSYTRMPTMTEINKKKAMRTSQERDNLYRTTRLMGDSARDLISEFNKLASGGLFNRDKERHLSSTPTNCKAAPLRDFCQQTSPVASENGSGQEPRSPDSIECGRIDFQEDNNTIFYSSPAKAAVTPPPPHSLRNSSCFNAFEENGPQSRNSVDYCDPQPRDLLSSSLSDCFAQTKRINRSMGSAGHVTASISVHDDGKVLLNCTVNPILSASLQDVDGGDMTSSDDEGIVTTPELAMGGGGENNRAAHRQMLLGNGSGVEVKPHEYFIDDELDEMDTSLRTLDDEVEIEVDEEGV